MQRGFTGFEGQQVSSPTSLPSSTPPTRGLLEEADFMEKMLLGRVLPEFRACNVSA